MRDLIPLYEGFMTYGGMSVREIEAMAVGLRETLDETVIGQSPSFIEYAVNELDAVSDWPEKLVARFKADFGDSL